MTLQHNAPICSTASLLMHSTLLCSILDCCAIQVSLHKHLVVNISQQCSASLMIALVDAEKHYDCTAHCPGTTLAIQSLSILTSITTCMFSTIQVMWFFLHTAFGDSTNFYGSASHNFISGSVPRQQSGTCVWLAIILCLLKTIHIVGHAHFCPITPPLCTPQLYLC